MQNTKMIKLLKSLSSSELRKFIEFVHSPIYNKQPRLMKFIAILSEEAPEYNGELADKKNIFPLLFPKEKYEEQKINNLISYLVKLLEEFMCWQRYSNQTVLRKQYLLSELRERNLNKYFQSLLLEMKTDLENALYREPDYYHQFYLLEREADNFFLKNENREYNESLQKKADYFDLYYLAEKLKACCEMINRKNIITADYKIKMLEEVISYVNKNKEEFEHTPIIRIYNQILLTLIEEEKEIHFITLKDILQDNIYRFPKEQIRQMYDYALNYCIKKLNKGNNDYLAEAFDLYNLLLDREIIFEEGQLSQWDYKNIVSVALRLEAFDWTKKFIKTYKEKIVAEFRENAYTYNLASFYYSTKDFGSAIKLLQQVEFTDVFYHLGAKSMLLKIYYDLRKTESFYSLVDTFNIYLKRNKLISSYQREVYTNMVKFTKKVFDLRLKTATKKYALEEEEIEKLKEEIQYDKKISNLKWLLEKIEEFEATLLKTTAFV